MKETYSVLSFVVLYFIVHSALHNFITILSWVYNKECHTSIAEVKGLNPVRA